MVSKIDGVHPNIAGYQIMAKVTDEAIAKATQADYREAFIIGGGEIFKEALPVADKIYLTRVDAELEGDTFFPVLNASDWNLSSERSFPADARHAYAYHFQTWEKNKIKK